MKSIRADIDLLMAEKFLQKLEFGIIGIIPAFALTSHPLNKQIECYINSSFYSDILLRIQTNLNNLYSIYSTLKN